MKNKNIMNTVLPIIPMILWGSLFPFVKIGYNAFSIDTERIGDILMLAAMRFSVCGIIGCIIAFIIYKIFGAVIGFCGIFIINIRGNMNGISKGDIVI